MQNEQAWKTKDKQRNDISDSCNNKSNSALQNSTIANRQTVSQPPTQGLTPVCQNFHVGFWNIILNNKSYAPVDYMTWRLTLCPTLFNSNLTAYGAHSSKWQENTTQCSKDVEWNASYMLRGNVPEFVWKDWGKYRLYTANHYMER
jgi:hypothetical protein